MTDKEWMEQALLLANEAADEGEVPVGALVVKDGQLISTGRNRRETAHNALAHAEMEALNGACTVLGGWRLSGCTLYVTLEPCPMCAGAIINARVDRVVYGADDPKAGSCGSLTNLFAVAYNHSPIVERGVLEEHCAAVLRDFFKKLRVKNQNGKELPKK